MGSRQTVIHQALGSPTLLDTSSLSVTRLQFSLLSVPYLAALIVLKLEELQGAVLLQGAGHVPLLAVDLGDDCRLRKTIAARTGGREAEAGGDCHGQMPANGCGKQEEARQDSRLTRQTTRG